VDAKEHDETAEQTGHEGGIWQEERERTAGVA